MDQLKEILGQLVKYRFWIIVGIAALLPTVGELLAGSQIQSQTEAKKKAIEDANSSVKGLSGGVVTPGAQSIVAEQTQKVEKDVNAAWRILFDRQAELLTWPQAVGDQFRDWGHKWPTDVDEAAVQRAIASYIAERPGYTEYVKDVYQSFDPFDDDTGEGLVTAPPMETLLTPVKFTLNNPPTLGQVWAAQEKIWVQASLLDVIARLNSQATDWKSATVKGITVLDVGTMATQDQRSMAKGDVLEPAPDLLSEAQEAAADASASSTDSSMSSDMMRGDSYGGMGSQKEGAFYYMQTEGAPYRVFPFYMVIQIEQNGLIDLFRELEQSPMGLQVKDFEMARPEVRVVEPIRGQQNSYAFGSGGYMGGRPGMTIFGGSPFGGPDMSSMNRGMPNYGAQRGFPGDSIRGGGGVGAEKSHTRRQDLPKKDEEEGTESPVKVQIFDPYYSVVEVKIYGQARIYEPPPPPEAVESEATTEGEPGQTSTEGGPDQAPPAGPESSTPETPENQPAPEAQPEAAPPNQAGEPSPETPAPMP